jgi:hypothetical protein
MSVSTIANVEEWVPGPKLNMEQHGTWNTVSENEGCPNLKTGADSETWNMNMYMNKDLEHVLGTWTWTWSMEHGTRPDKIGRPNSY